MIRVATNEEAYRAFSNIPELDRYLSPDEFNSRIPHNALVLVYEVEQELAGFKIGYPLDGVEFYSWLGGVLPGFRNRGIAQELLDYQERRVIEQGYQRISVKSMNRYSLMIRFLVKNGYKIAKVEDFDTDKERIHFLKHLP